MYSQKFQRGEGLTNFLVFKNWKFYPLYLYNVGGEILRAFEEEVIADIHMLRHIVSTEGTTI